MIKILHRQEVQEAINFIENHISEDITIARVAKEIKLSMYYFHRIFQEEIGMNLNEYIRSRKLALGASLLVNTDEEILAIAIYLGFNSQEAFTRSFKKVYQLPPSRYRKIIGGLIQKEDLKMDQNKIKGWTLTGTAPEKFETFLDTKIFNKEKKAACLRSVSDETIASGDFATLMQSFSAADYLNKRICFSGFVKSQNVKDWAGLWTRIDDQQQLNMLGFDNMQNRSIKGTTEWNHYSVVLDVPKESALINIEYWLPA